jgi:serine/threonine-protein kinase
LYWIEHEYDSGVHDRESAALSPSPTNLRELFEAAIALGAGERAAFLDRECPDARVRARIESMLRADETDDEPVSRQGLDRLACAIGDEPAPPPPGSRIGPFEIVRVIGEGGSSTVFEAQRELEGATQRVALKL